MATVNPQIAAFCWGIFTRLWLSIVIRFTIVPISHVIPQGKIINADTKLNVYDYWVISLVYGDFILSLKRFTWINEWGQSPGNLSKFRWFPKLAGTICCLDCKILKCRALSIYKIHINSNLLNNFLIILKIYDFHWRMPNSFLLLYNPYKTLTNHFSNIKPQIFTTHSIVL